MKLSTIPILGKLFDLSNVDEAFRDDGLPGIPADDPDKIPPDEGDHAPPPSV